MNISYIDQATRSLCYSLINPISPFTAEEIIEIRAHIADLRAAPSLADAPVEYSLIADKEIDNSSLCLKIEFGRIFIICRIISNVPDPKPKEIKRLQISKINIFDFKKVSKGKSRTYDFK